MSSTNPSPPNSANGLYTPPHGEYIAVPTTSPDLRRAISPIASPVAFLQNQQRGLNPALRYLQQQHAVEHGNHESVTKSQPQQQLFGGSPSGKSPSTAINNYYNAGPPTGMNEAHDPLVEEKPRRCDCDIPFLVSSVGLRSVQIVINVIVFFASLGLTKQCDREYHTSTKIFLFVQPFIWVVEILFCIGLSRMRGVVTVLPNHPIMLIAKFFVGLSPFLGWSALLYRSSSRHHGDNEQAVYPFVAFVGVGSAGWSVFGTCLAYLSIFKEGCMTFLSSAMVVVIVIQLAQYAWGLMLLLATAWLSKTCFNKY